MTVLPRVSPRFGWFDPTHRAINLGAIHQLPGSTPKESAWKEFLVSQFPRLMAADSLRDVNYEGPTHYTDVKERGNVTAAQRPLYKVPGYQLWQEAQKAFTKKNMEAFQEDLAQNPFTPGKEGEPDSLFTNLKEAFDLAKKELDQFAKGLPRLVLMLNGDPAHDNPLIQGAKDDLVDNLGWLTHMVGDSSMPLHTASANGDWPLEPHPKMGNLVFPEGIHAFIEGSTLSDEDHAALIEHAQNVEPLNSSFFNQSDLFTQVLAPQFTDSYLLNRDILKAHKDALNPEKEVDREKLKTDLKGILIPHIQKAQTRMAWVLHSIWKQADEPAFDIKPPKSASTS